MNNEISYTASFVFLFGMSFQALTSCFKVALDAADEHNDAWWLPRISEGLRCEVVLVSDVSHAWQSNANLYTYTYIYTSNNV